MPILFLLRSTVLTLSSPCPHPVHTSAALQYATDREPIVADSCIVALDMLEHEQSGNLEYCATA
jgi:hypothetical protein